MTNPPDAKTTLIALLLLILAYVLLANGFNTGPDRPPGSCQSGRPQTEECADFR